MEDYDRVQLSKYVDGALALELDPQHRSVDTGQLFYGDDAGGRVFFCSPAASQGDWLAMRGAGCDEQRLRQCRKHIDQMWTTENLSSFGPDTDAKSEKLYPSSSSGGRVSISTL